MLLTRPHSHAPSPYVAVAVRAFRRYATYRGATFAGAVTNTMFGFVYAGVFAAVHEVTGAVAGYTAAETTTYVFGAQAFLAMTGAFGEREIAERVRTGDIAADLYRPVDFQAWWLSHDLGRASFHAIFRGIPPFVVGAVALDLPVPAAAATWLAFLFAAFLGVVLAFTIRFLANLAAFWLLDARGVVTLTVLAQVFLAGHVVPLYFMPDRLEAVVRVLPFAGITAHPVEILVGGHRGDLLRVYVLQLAWIAALLFAGRVMLRAAQRKLVVQGG